MITLPPISTEITASLEPLRLSFAAAQTEAKQMADGMAKAIDDAPIFGPAVKARFDGFEQSVRDGMARTIKQMRDDAVQANIDEEIKLRLYGQKQMEEDVAQAEAAIGEMKAQAAASEEGGILESLKGSFGRGSAFFEMGHLLEGAGPILGISLVANVMKESTEHAAKLADEFRAGAVSGGEMADQIARSLPILGSIYEAGRNIREMITGEDAEVKKITDDANAMSAAVDLTREAWKQTEELTATIDGTIQKIEEQIAQLRGETVVPIGPDFKRNLDESQKLATDAVKNINDAIENQLGKQNIHTLDELKKKIDELHVAASRAVPALQSKTIIPGTTGGSAVDNASEVQAAKDAVADAKKQLSELEPVLQGFQNEMQKAQAGTVKIGAENVKLFAQEWLKGIEDVGTGFENAFRKMQDKITKQIADAQKELDEAGMTESQRKLYEFSHQPGVTQSEVDRYKAITDQIDASKAAADAAKKMDDEVNQFRDRMKTPIDRANDLLKEFGEWQRDGKITLLEMRQWGIEEMQKANQEMVEKSGGRIKDDPHFADLIRPGSGEALKLQFAAAVDRDGSKDANEIAGKQLDVQMQISQWLNLIYSNNSIQLYQGLE